MDTLPTELKEIILWRYISSPRQILKLARLSKSWNAFIEATFPLLLLKRFQIAPSENPKEQYKSLHYSSICRAGQTALGAWVDDTNYFEKEDRYLRLKLVFWLDIRFLFQTPLPGLYKVILDISQAESFLNMMNRSPIVRDNLKLIVRDERDVILVDEKFFDLPVVRTHERQTVVVGEVQIVDFETNLIVNLIETISNQTKMHLVIHEVKLVERMESEHGITVESTRNPGGIVSRALRWLKG
jgi:hypothetical protein